MNKIFEYSEIEAAIAIFTLKASLSIICKNLGWLHVLVSTGTLSQGDGSDGAGQTVKR